MMWRVPSIFMARRPPFRSRRVLPCCWRDWVSSRELSAAAGQDPKFGDGFGRSRTCERLQVHFFAACLAPCAVIGSRPPTAWRLNRFVRVLRRMLRAGGSGAGNAADQRLGEACRGRGTTQITGAHLVDVQEDRLFKRPFPTPRHPEHGRTGGHTAPDALESVFGCRLRSAGELLGVDGPAKMRLPLAPSTGYPLPSGRFHRSRNQSDAADPGGPGRRVAGSPEL